MRLMIHFLVADVGRLRWIIAGWIAVTAAVITFQAMTPFIEVSPRVSRSVDAATTFGWFAQILVAATLLPLVIQTHPAVGTSAFWMTRPFPRLTLAESKLVMLAGLFLGVPAVCDAAIMAFYRVPTATLLLALVEASLERAVLVVVFGTIASLTHSYARFLLTLSGMAAAAIVAFNVWFLIVMNRPDSAVTGYLVATSSPVWAGPGVPPPGGAVAVMSATILLGALVLCVQYARRSRVRTLAVAAVGVVAVASMGMAWSPERPRRIAPPEWTNDPSTARLAALDSTVVFDGGPGTSLELGWKVGRAKVLLEETPPGWITATRLRRAVMQLDDGREIVSAGHGFGTSLPEAVDRRNPVDQELRALLEVDRLAGFAADMGEYAILLALRKNQLSDFGFVGRYRGDFAIDLQRISIASVLPLERDAMYQSGAYRFVVAAAGFSEMGPRIRVRVSDASPMFDSTPGHSYFYFLRNPSRREALRANQPHWRDGRFTSSFLSLAGVSVAGLLPFSVASEDILFPSYVTDFKDITVDEAWMHGAHLVLVKVEHAGTIERMIEIPQLRFAPQQRAQ